MRLDPRAHVYVIGDKNIDAVRCLLRLGVNPNLANINGEKPLMEALFDTLTPSIEIVRFLLRAGAKILATSKMGDSALSLAEATENAEIIQMLRGRTGLAMLNSRGSVKDVVGGGYVQ